MTATPALWGILTQDYIEASRGEGEQGEDTSLLPSLKVVSIGGEAMPSEVSTLLCAIVLNAFNSPFLANSILGSPASTDKHIWSDGGNRVSSNQLNPLIRIRIEK